jgi:hypothetical protein
MRSGLFGVELSPGASMNYQEFRDLWHEALREARLPIPYPIGPTEKINLSSMSRSYECVIHGGLSPNSEPFHLSVKIEWDWDATLSARYATTEEDMLMQIFGDFRIHTEDTVLPWLRIDVNLFAGIPYETVYTMPLLDQWQRWFRQVSDELQLILPTGYDENGRVCAYSDPIQAGVRLLEDGRLNLESVTFKAWQAIKLPRQWDDPEKGDPSPAAELRDFALRISRAMSVMDNSLALLVKSKSS